MSSQYMEEDKDAWMYSSMDKYEELSMYEMEWPPDTLTLLSSNSLGLSGIQEYSKKCELLQLSIPPKLLPLGEGPLKERDFQIISGGYASSRITQLRGLKGRDGEDFLVTGQQGEGGFTLYKCGDKDNGVIREVLKVGSYPSQGPLCTSSSSSKVFLGIEGTLYAWDLGGGSCSVPPPTLHPIPRIKPGKLKMWDDNTISLGDSQGALSLYDLRSSKQTHEISSRSVVESGRRGLYCWDSVPSRHMLSLLSSLGEYSCYDIRVGGDKVLSQAELPFDGSQGVLRDRFSMEWQENTNEFLVVGLCEKVVYIIGEDKEVGVDKCGGGDVDKISGKFVHDGHSKIVTHAIYHDTVKRLVFSSSGDSMLHAWRYKISEGEDKCT